MKKFMLSIGLVALYTSLPQSIAAQQPTSPPYKYPQDVITEYTNSCITRSTSQNLTRDTATKLCTCTLNRFQAQYTVERFKQLRADANKKNPQATSALTAVGYACMDEILYEN